MSNLNELLEIDENDPIMMLAIKLTENHDKLIETLIKRRKRLNLTQQDIADRMGIELETFQLLEDHAATDFRMSTLRRWLLSLEAQIVFTVEEWPNFGNAGSL